MEDFRKGRGASPATLWSVPTAMPKRKAAVSRWAAGQDLELSSQYAKALESGDGQGRSEVA